MKRVMVWLWAAMVLGAPLLWADGVSKLSGAAGLGGSGQWASVAQAASDCDTFKKSNPDGSASTECSSGSGLNQNSKDCKGVKIGLPILNKGETCLSNDPKTGGAIVTYLRMFLRLLGAAVGLVVVMMLVLAGVQYIASTGDPGRVKAAKDRVQNAIIALIAYLSMFAILSFIVPGGIL